MTKDEIADRVAAIIQKALRRNLYLEIITVILLATVAGVGIYLLLRGASDRSWELLISGAACEASVGWPVVNLLNLRRFNLLFQTLPELIRMADTEDGKKLFYAFIERLMERL